MQAVILAAGNGKRMGELTKEFPKALLQYQNKTLLHWKLDALPEIIDEVIIIIGFQGQKIKDAVGTNYKGKKISYVEENEAKGTGFALWQAANLLNDDFIVLMGDDIYSLESIQNACNYPWSLTVKKVSREDNSSRVLRDDKGKFIGFVIADKYREKQTDGGIAFTGLYSLTKKIFDYPLIKMKTKDEWGLPQTLAGFAKDIDLKIIETNFWIPISAPEDLV